MEHYEYVHLLINIITEEIRIHYNLRDMNKNRYIYADIRKVMYGLPYVGLISKLISFQKTCTTWILPMLAHTRTMEAQLETSDFSLLVDDVGVKYFEREHVKHLFMCIQKYFLA